jgi:hypothetical protein
MGWKRYAGYGITLLGETIDEIINHEMNFLEENLSHCAHVYCHE